MFEGIFKAIWRLILWGMGIDQSTRGSSGFVGDDLVAKRTLTRFERWLKAFCTLLFLAVLPAYLLGDASSLLSPDSYWCALPSAAWVAFMLIRRTTPMDGEAIGTGLWTFSPYVGIACWLVIGFIRLDHLPYRSLLWQAGALAVTIAYGLIRDISREMDKRA